MKKIMKLLLLVLLSKASIAQQKSVLPVNDFEKAVQVKNVQLVDVRTPQEFKEGFIAGAVNADWQNENQFAAQVKKLDKNAPVYVYC